MKQAQDFFTPAEKETINRAVADAEKGTSGEIVPVVASASGRYDRAADVGGFLLGLAALVVIWSQFQRVVPVGGDWEQGQQLTLGVHWVVLIVVVGFILGATFISHIGWLRYLLVTRHPMREAVRRRAWEAFGRFHVGKTAAGTGIVLYLSLFERMVCVQGDDTISQKLDPKTWEELRDIVISGIREGRAAEGLCQAISRCGEILGQHFPIQPGDINELPNQLRVLD